MYNDQKKNENENENEKKIVYKTLHRKLKIEQQEP
jgi:hypothetical protein